jgi:hypothetical protein
MEWEALVARYKLYSERREFGRGQIEIAKTLASGARERLFAGIGDHVNQLNVGYFAGEVASLEAGFPILEDAMRALGAEIQAHVATMRAFAKKNRIPKEVLSDLPE